MDFVRQKPVELDYYPLSNIFKSVKEMMNVPTNIKINFPETDVEILCNEKECEILFYNIITNSIQAIGNKEGQIIIRIKETKKEFKIEIEDPGSGISSENLDQIFEPLFTTKQTGTGLGLTSCKNIIGRLGGTISVKNNPTRFIIKLPRKLD